MQRGTIGEYVREFKELMLQVSDVTEKEALLAFQNGLKSWVRQVVEQKGVQKLSKAMTVVESVVKLGLGKDKLGFSKFEEKGVCEKGQKEDVDGNGNIDNSGLGTWFECKGVEANEAESEKKLVECFLCHGLHRLQKCPRKSVFEGNYGADKEPKKLGLSKGKAEDKRAKRSKKKQVKYFLCRGLHEL
ncbi:hypothetical protein Goklo_024952 [Gossypium klotzschianum]|uniref:Retrotransposon gag domain-containing protein n=1 Tax=Gossypium klotzschianum TaxID=34286 RepID=A0A7J8W5Z5_9ROSI|nr:hypothetical protein [Gossypium klotzschianum]